MLVPTPPHPTLQVCPRSLCLVDGKELVEQLAVADLIPGAPGTLTVTGASIADPYLLLLLSNGQCLVLQADGMSMCLNIVEGAKALLSGAPLLRGGKRPTAACLYCNEGGVFTGLEAAAPAEGGCAAACWSLSCMQKRPNVV